MPRKARRPRRPRHQVCARNFEGSCFFCDESRPEALQCHRIFPGGKGGKYQFGNTLVLCATHHALVTAGRIKVHASYPCTFSLRAVHWTDERGAEHYSPWPKPPKRSL